MAKTVPEGGITRNERLCDSMLVNVTVAFEMLPTL